MTRVRDLAFAGIKGAIDYDRPLANLTWLRTGGPAECLFQPQGEADLAAFLHQLPADVPVTVIGLGSNLLVRDGGLDGVVIRLSARGFGGIERVDDKQLRVGAAVPDKLLANAALDAGLAGFAFYAGIPGAIGGALRMNAGANGDETAGRLISVRAVARTGEIVELTRGEMGYAYRHCGAPEGLIFTSALMAGTPAPDGEIRAAMASVVAHREASQPIRARTGGSTFKNPPGQSAWKLIDAAGCRGLSVGAAQMSDMHCNFMINTGAASGHDLELLGETVRARVAAGSGIDLEWEIRRLGRFAAGGEVAPFLGR